ncbi:hypothetical protein [Belliella pelovolcani]|uniref:Uncharacterized protein n=1 Tax=Belliella pelovolcani TaxID=529505 RepID=A0A1N7MR39_9BACT|nr:hypothetical protein [Belliella pelovolcani]SIS88411.1 hypothetical protein SAMN05421761_10745 [Belliella pelovolcani]
MEQKFINIEQPKKIKLLSDKNLDYLINSKDNQLTDNEMKLVIDIIGEDTYKVLMQKQSIFFKTIHINSQNEYFVYHLGEDCKFVSYIQDIKYNNILGLISENILESGF